MIYLPKTEELVDSITFSKYEEAESNTVAVRIEVRGRDIVIQTKSQEETSEDYPIEVTGWREDVGPNPLVRAGIKFNIPLSDLDILQYFDLMKIEKLEENDDIKSVKIINEKEDEIDDVNVDTFNAPNIDNPFGRERIKVLYRLQKATQRRIPLPYELSPKQIKIIDKWIQQSPSSDEANAIIDQLKDAGNKYRTIPIWVTQMDPGRDQQETVFAGISLQNLNIKIGNGGTNLKEDTIPLAQMHYPGNFEDIVRSIQSDPESIVSILHKLINDTSEQQGRTNEVSQSIDEFNPENESLVTILYSENSAFWSIEDHLELQVVENYDDV